MHPIFTDAELRQIDTAAERRVSDDLWRAKNIVQTVAADANINPAFAEALRGVTFDLGPRDDDRPANWPTAHALAERFGAEMRQQLTRDQLIEANRINEADGYGASTCATHDYCDANMVLLAAWAGLIGVDEDEIDVCDDRTIDLWNEAWSIAKRAHFGVLFGLLS